MLIIAGPCALTSSQQKMSFLAGLLAGAGADVFRAGLWKGGTFPPALGSPAWGVGYDGIPTMEAIAAYMPVATEIRSLEQLEACQKFEYVWTPARQMQNYDMIRNLGAAIGGLKKYENTKLMIKRAPGASIRDVLGIYQHLDQVGMPADRLWIVERGISGLGYEEEVRWRPDILSIPQLKGILKGFGAKVMFDVSHSCGRREYVIPMAKAAAAAGADGLMVEAMEVPEESLSDARQTISVDNFKILVKEARKIA